jgi:molecular chaperone GrpE (heat shock protein)
MNQEDKQTHTKHTAFTLNRHHKNKPQNEGQGEQINNSEIKQEFIQEIDKDSTSADEQNDLIFNLEDKKILENKILSLEDVIIRKEADLQNIIRQNQFDIANSKKSTKKSVAMQILHVMNTLSLAFQHLPQVENADFDKFIQTLISSFDKSIQDLKLVGIEIVVPKIGDLVDLNYMNLLNTPQDQSDLTIKQVVSVGLKIEDQVVQPASVLA